MSAFLSWFDNAEPGEKTVYYEGELARARVLSTDPLRRHLVTEEAASGLADASMALTLGEAGRLHLLQERAGKGWRYIAIKASRRGVVAGRSWKRAQEA